MKVSATTVSEARLLAQSVQTTRATIKAWAERHADPDVEAVATSAFCRGEPVSEDDLERIGRYLGWLSDSDE